MDTQNNGLFWQKLDILYYSSELVITKAKGARHDVYDNLIYPVDYGYLKDTSTETEEHIAIYKGSNDDGRIDKVVVCVDILKKDIEVKLLLNCTSKETNDILRFLNQTDFQKSIIVSRGHSIPSWAVKNDD